MKCDEWAKKDSRVIVIHKKNGGLSSSRNAALDIAKGEFYYFLDSDDYIEKRAIEELVNCSRKFDADIVEGVFWHVYGDRIISKPNKVSRQISINQALTFDLGTRGGSCSACAKLFKNKIFKTYRFKEGKLFEDLFSNAEILLKADSFAVCYNSIYYYVHRPNSITTAPFNQKSLDNIEAAKYNYNIIKENAPQVLDVAIFRLDHAVIQTIDRMLLTEYYTDIPESVAQAYKNAIKTLEDLKKGIISLQTEEETSVRTSGEYRTNKTESDRLFNKRVMNLEY